MKIIVKNSKYHGKGVFATKSIKKGEFIDSFRGKTVKKDGIHVLWISDEEGILVQNDLKYANHDWENPNAEIKGIKLYAKRNIRKGDEILWDYSCGYCFEQNINLKNPLFDSNELSVIHYSIMNGNKDVFKNCLKTIKRNKMDLNSFDTYLDDDREYKGSILNWIVMFSRLDLLKIYLENKLPYDLKSSDYGYNVLHSAFYYGDTKILNYLFKNLSVKEIERLLLDKSKSEEFPLDFISIDGGKGYSYIVDYLFKKVYRTRELDFTAIRVNTDEFDNYFLGDYLLDSCNFSLFKNFIKT
jgi:hypothetical protein